MPTFLHSLPLPAFIVQGHCYPWQPELVGLQIGADALTALANYSIAAALFYFVYKRQTLPIRWALLLFATCIMAYGTTHLMEIWALWYPTYWVSGALKVVAALTSLVTAVLLLPLMLKALAWPNLDELRTNQTLEREIAERQQVEAALRESEEKYRLLFSNELDAVSLFDVETGQLLDVNAAFEELYGYNRVEALQLRVADVSAEYAQSQTAIRLANSTGKARIYLRWHRKKDGTIFPVELCVGRFIWRERPVMCAVARDITDRQQAEAALRESEERFRQIAETIQEVFWVATADLTQILYVSPAYEAIWKQPCASLYEQPKSFIDAIHPDDRTQALAVLEAQQNSGFSHEYRIVRPDGSIRWIWERAFSVCDQAGNPYRIVGAAQDITDRKLAEAALGLADFSFDRSAVAAVWIGRDAQILRVNEGACQLLGYSREELQAMYVYELDPNFPREVWAEHWEMLRQQKTIVMVSQLQTKAGTFVPIETTLNYLEFNGEEYNFAFAKDISKQLKAEAALRQQTERERVLASVTDHIRHSLEFEKTLNAAVVEVRRLLHSDRVLIYRFHSDWSGTIVAESVCSGELSILNRSIHDPCFANSWYAAYQQGCFSEIADIETSDIQPCHRDLLRSFQVRAHLVVPILHDSSLWGLLLVHHCSAPHPWQPWEIDSLHQLTAQLAIALQQSELYRQVQQFNTRLEQQVQERTEQLQQSLDFEALLKRITDKVRDSLEEAQILQTAVQALAVGLNVLCCNVALYDFEQESATVSYEYINSGVLPAQGQTFLFSNLPGVYDHLLQGQWVQFGRGAAPDVWRESCSPQVTILSCPLIDDQAVIGDLWLYKAAEQCFEDLEIRLVQQVANQCAIAVRQARLYQAAQTQVQELERLHHLKDDFLSTVSHELRTPMASIMMATQLLKIILQPLGVLDPVSGSASRYFQILQDECQREISLINDLLDLSRLESGVEPLAIAPVDLRLWIPHVLEPFEERTRIRQQQLQLEIPEHLPCLETDLSYLERVLTELLNNACKYTPAEETILIAVRATSDQLQLSVSNSGVEIPANELPHLFEKFYRVPSHDPWKHGGTGLGLALVQRCVKQLQGTITVTSEAGWITFVMLLPWHLERQVPN